jgi:hypothetical protein
MAMPTAGLGEAYRDAFVDTGNQPELLFLLAFLLTFGFIRTSAHLIRAEVSWWPGNVEVGGTHIHHLVWGILLLLVVGYVGVAIEPPSPWHEVVAVLFGVGTGLTLDEFALWLNLRDVYWSKEGRRSIDAVIVAAILAGFTALGFGIWIELAGDVEGAVFTIVGAFGALHLLFALVNLAKEKLATGALGLLLLPIGAAGAFRLAKPHSVWARVLYGERKMARARKRFGAAPKRTAGEPPGKGPSAARTPSQSAAGSG